MTRESSTHNKTQGQNALYNHYNLAAYFLSQKLHTVCPHLNEMKHMADVNFLRPLKTENLSTNQQTKIKMTDQQYPAITCVYCKNAKCNPIIRAADLLVNVHYASEDDHILQDIVGLAYGIWILTCPGIMSHGFSF